MGAHSGANWYRFAEYVLELRAVVGQQATKKADQNILSAEEAPLRLAA